MQKLCQCFRNAEKGPNNTKKLVDGLKYCCIQNGVHISKWPPTCMSKSINLQKMCITCLFYKVLTSIIMCSHMLNMFLAILIQNGVQYSKWPPTNMSKSINIQKMCFTCLFDKILTKIIMYSYMLNIFLAILIQNGVHFNMADMSTMSTLV